MYTEICISIQIVRCFCFHFTHLHSDATAFISVWQTSPIKLISIIFLLSKKHPIIFHAMMFCMHSTSFTFKNNDFTFTKIASNYCDLQDNVIKCSIPFHTISFVYISGRHWPLSINNKTDACFFHSLHMFNCFWITYVINNHPNRQFVWLIANYKREY